VHPSTKSFGPIFGKTTTSNVTRANAVREELTPSGCVEQCPPSRPLDLRQLKRLLIIAVYNLKREVH